MILIYFSPCNVFIRSVPSASSGPAPKSNVGARTHLRADLELIRLRSSGLQHHLAGAYGNSPKIQSLNFRKQLDERASGLLMVGSWAWRPCAHTATGALPRTPSTSSASAGRCW